MMKKLCSILLAMLLILCCGTALAEQCKYYHEDSPCDVHWWVDTQKREHARACFNHVEDKEDMDSHVLVTDWAPCSLDEGGECTVCGWDYVRDPRPDDYDMYWLEAFYIYQEMYGDVPYKVSVSNGKLTITFNSDFFAFLEEMGVPYTESAMVGTELSLAEVDGVWTVASNGYGPGPWLERVGMLRIENIDTADGKAMITVNGVAYTLSSDGTVDCPHAAWCGEPNVCKRCGATDVTLPQDAMEHYSEIFVDLGMEHQCQCPCGYLVYWSSQHSAVCDNPDVCQDCGLDISGREGIRVRHDGEQVSWDYDEYYHWQMCAACGWTSDWEPHGAMCNNGSACESCGAENVILEGVWHHGEWEADENWCWLVCMYCGEQLEDPQPHTQRCSEPGRCTWCGSTDVVFGDEISHDWDSSFEYDEWQHWRICNGCGTEFDYSEHYGPCAPGNVCNGCDAENVHIEWPWHENRWAHDETDCWMMCELCGEEEGRRPHSEMCSEPGKCSRCGSTDVMFGEIDHNWDSPYQHNEMNHWNVCVDCGETFNMSIHYGPCAAGDVCEGCGAENVMLEDRWHEFEWKSDDTECWTICAYCGYEERHWPHSEFCAEPGQCIRCGRTDVVFGELDHNWDSPFEYDASMHWRICRDCGAEFGESEHYGDCTPGNVCEECGGKDIYIEYPWHEQDWKSDATQCWNECPKCGKTEDRWLHTEQCSAPGKCVRCERTDVTFGDLEHRWDSPFEHTERNHWQVCYACGETFGFDVHFGPCTNGGRCENCGEKDVILDYVWHDEKFESNDQFCWGVCQDCGNVGSKQYHRASCVAPEMCWNCGGTDVVIAETQHNWNSPFGSDEDFHWRICQDCGDKFEQSTHYASCKNPGVCSECGEKVGANVWVNHNWMSPYEYNEVEHWQICSDCNQTVNMSDHYYECDKPGVCYSCKATDVVMYKEHPWTEATQHDEYFCWKSCEKCGEEYYKQSHRARCIQPERCDNCKSADVLLEATEHYTTVVKKVDETTHETYCADCQQVVNEEQHNNNCTDPEGFCDDCASEGVKIGRVYHANAHQQRLYDKTQHWAVCSLCGNVGDKYLHYNYCNEEGCSYCEGEGVTVTLHYHTGTYQYDEKSHWIMCVNCGEVPAEAHYYINGVCQYCGCERTVLPGDASGDGQVDIMDALDVLQAAVGWGNAINNDAADVDGSGQVDIMDALLILQYAVGWDVELK